ncbi:hypothetical protein FSP39_014740 [Pinctada imbricata]|uniref:Uncharacterized protein n=1 Tax=Pinctada imbricata TaxID=66713 RepID=A0AA88Y5C5_PINIB|nr:hypothetical protein FSP39_014740 [Pinctada imbricata]
MSPSMESLRTFTYEQRRSTESRQSMETYQTPEVSQSVLWSSLRPVSSKEQGSSYDVSTLSSVIIQHATTHQIPQTSANMKHHINISESVNTTQSVHSQRPSTHSSVSNGTMKPSSTPKSELKPSSSIRPSGPSSKSHGQIPTPRPVVPPVFIRLQFKMTLSEFCSEKSKFITELVEIVQTETAQRLEDDQIVFLNSQEISCIPEYDEIMPPSKMDDEHVKIDLYVIDVKGEIDITLTIDFEKMIVPGFKTLPQSHFGEKLVDVKLVQQKSPSSEASSEDSSSSSLGSGITVAIIIASVGGFCCCCLIILQIIIHKRHGKRFNNFDSASTQLSIRSMDSIALGAVSKSRPHSGFFNPGLEYDDQTANKEPSHLLGYTSLSNFTLDTRGMEHEFEKIPYEMPNLATVPIGAEDKNRFANVIPHPHTRVKLKTIEGEDTSEYINANYVTGYRGNFKAYIATQAPMTNTMRDFWRMVWEQQSRVILMLVPMDERGQNNLLREIRHFWITCWPRDGLPEPISLIKFILDTRVHYEDSGAPVIVHCSPGTGRTGTLIATDICMRSYERKRMVDILNSVHKLRQERAGAVQTKEQYTLIYKAVYEYSVIMSSPSISTASSAIALHNML